MKAGDVAFDLLSNEVCIIVLHYDGYWFGTKNGDGNHAARERGDIRPLTPEEQAAHALGWRGPGQQSNP